MVSEEVAKKIREIEIVTRRLLNGSLIGDQRSAIKGSGFEFDQIREYQIGDDVRTIDWKSSARMDTLLVKEYIQERDRVVIVAVDVSASTVFSSGNTLKSSIIAELASVLALVADYSRDAVSLLLFSDDIELSIPPGRGIQHVRMIMEKLFTFQPRKQKTNIEVVFDRLLAHARSDSIVLLVSDFIDDSINSSKKLSVVARKYDLIAIRCLDRNERALPAVGFISVQDSETGQETVLDLRFSGAQKGSSFLQNHAQEQEKLFKKNGIELLDIAIEKPFIGELVRFFKQRMSY
jgi:uncharacterized protein (DUF58 family)